MRTRRNVAPKATEMQGPRFTETDIARAYDNGVDGLKILFERSQQLDAEAYGVLVDMANQVIEKVGDMGSEKDKARRKQQGGPTYKRRRPGDAAGMSNEELDDTYGDIITATEAIFERAANCGDSVAAKALAKFAREMIHTAASLLPAEAH